MVKGPGWGGGGSLDTPTATMAYANLQVGRWGWWGWWGSGAVGQWAVGVVGPLLRAGCWAGQVLLLKSDARMHKTAREGSTSSFMPTRSLLNT